jgi:hypothetical protein
VYSRIFLIMGRFTNGKEDPKGLRLIKMMSTTSSTGAPSGTSKYRTSS